MSQDRLSRVMFWLAAFDAVVLLGFGILHPLIGDWSSNVDRVIFGALVAGGGALVVAGLIAFRSSTKGSAVLIGLGAVLGAFGMFWLPVVPLLAIVLIVLGVMRARRLDRTGTVTSTATP